MSDFTLTSEQEAILLAARTSKDSLLINALAGAAKTSTLVLAAAKLPLVPTFVGAFNKRIADELQKRMPSHIDVRTMNAVGHRVWGAKLGKRLTVETDKGYLILTSLVEKLPVAERKEVGEMFASLLRGVRAAKSLGYIPPKMKALSSEQLLSREEFIDAVANQLDVNPDDYFMDLLDKALSISITQAFDGRIDFDDQIYMSTLFGGQYPKYDIVMVDEAQDLSALNHLSLSKMVGKRLIAVGDPNQAIYGFRGAHTSSMSVLREQFNMTEMNLSVSFRCPRAVVRRQWERVPNMQWPEWAAEGIVEAKAEWSAADIPDGAAIICRNNAPLFSCALRLIRAGRGVKIVGADIGKSLIKTLEGVGGNVNLDKEPLLTAIQAWEDGETIKAHKARRAGITDKAACLRVFAEAGTNKTEAIAFAKHIFAAEGPITLLTVHKAKGEEYEVVYFLEPRLIPSRWSVEAAEDGDDTQLNQEYNLRYVGETRTKRELYFIELEDML